MFCLSDYKQLSFIEQVSELKSLSFQQPVKFLRLLKDNFDLTPFIPETFTHHYYSNLGCSRDFNLSSILAALLIEHFFHIPTDSLLCIFLAFSPDIRKFCRFENKIPDETFFSRFKTTFEKDIANLFDSMVPHILDICCRIDEKLPTGSKDNGFSETLIYDTSGLKPKVKENNPKTLASEIKRCETYAKIINNKEYNPYLAAYGNLPKYAECNPAFRLDFVNGHFGYFYKFGLLTNGLGIPLRIHFFDDDFYSSIKTNFNSPQEQKYQFDNASLKPALKPFLDSFTTFRFRRFLGDSEFDSYENFGFLKSCNFEKVFIPLNPRNSKDDASSPLDVDEDGTPLCPLTHKPFLPDGSCKGKNRSFRLKYVCPESVRYKTNWKCMCQTPCKPTKSTVTSYKYPDKDFRMYPGIQRCSPEWDYEYKGRCAIERELSSLKKNPRIEAPRTLNTATMRADLYLAGITKLITVVLAYALNQPQYLRNINKLVKAAA